MSAAADPEALPGGLQEIADDFAALSGPDRLQLLLEFSEELPALPARLAEDPGLLEPVPECQSPIFLTVEVDGAGDGQPAPPDAAVRLFFSAPPEAPTTRGFAGILAEGLDGSSAETVLAVPADLPLRLSLEDQVSPLRLRGMGGMLGRIQRQVREQTGA
ncbi:cysteine desulfuration protein SufE [Brevibacterium sp. 5221]|uniref:Cysteine desulfuration protein SufE n=1 Tax=Brevibacterium rongguiense TaxID=2695267 RepID=A0A6N9H739_9MICO|nr:SufE family protein [Brevibacterium rongguiense]MYM19773.1 cysteine desulfuration protein SufE [Brevibacterium rongguiense]